MSRRRKKITVQAFANKRFPVENKNGESDRILFPAYLTVIYNQKNTKFKVTINNSDVLIEDKKSELESPELKKYISEVESIVEAEVNDKTDDFTLVGLSKRIEKYQKPIEHSLDNLINRRILELLYFNHERAKKYRTLKHKDGFKIEVTAETGNVSIDLDNVTEFYIWTQVMLTNFSNGKVSVYDWIYGNAKDNFSSLSKDSRMPLLMSMLNNFLEFYLWE